MLEIILANFGFWFNFLVPVAIAMFLVLTHKEYIWKEFGIQAGATFAYVALIYALLFSVTTDLYDTNYVNSSIKSSTYYEEWTELVTYTESYSCGTSKNPRTCTRTKTRRDHHSPYYQIKTKLGETISISRGEFLKSSRDFGKKLVRLHHGGQVSIGDGDKYVSYPSTIIPTSVGHTYENYVAVANQNVIHTKVPKENIKLLVKEGKLREYPELYDGVYGETLLNRVIDTTGLIRINYKKLNLIATQLGEARQANPIIYVTREDSSFVDALSQYWNKGKKNDVTFVIGVNSEGVIIWTDVICFTNNTDFIVDMQNDFTIKETKLNDKSVIEHFSYLVNKSYIRKPMKEFEYLKENITLEWYWQLLIFMGNLIMSGFITYKFLNNYDRKRTWK